MLKNFQLGAIIKPKNQWGLRVFSFYDDSLRRTFADEWERQYKTFMDGKKEIPFTTSDEPAADEYFSIYSYKLDKSLAGVNSGNTRNIAEIRINSIPDSLIKGIVAFARDDGNNELMLFQNFSRRQIIQAKMSLYHDSDTYKGIEGRVLGFDDKLRAVYSSRDEKLLFDKYPSTSRILDLSNYYYVASNKDIRDLLEHPLFACEDMQRIMTNSEYFHRRRFAMLRDSDILENISAGDVERISDRHCLGIRVRGDRIVFPEESDVAKTLLQLLNEEIYQGELSGTLFQANSKRPYRS